MDVVCSNKIADNEEILIRIGSHGNISIYIQYQMEDYAILHYTEAALNWNVGGDFVGHPSVFLRGNQCQYLYPHG